MSKVRKRFLIATQYLIHSKTPRRTQHPYSSDIAFTGHTPAHEPQLTQMSALMTCRPSSSKIAETGHSLVQASQLMQAFEIL